MNPLNLGQNSRFTDLPHTEAFGRETQEQWHKWIYTAEYAKYTKLCSFILSIIIHAFISVTLIQISRATHEKRPAASRVKISFVQGSNSTSASSKGAAYTPRLPHDSNKKVRPPSSWMKKAQTKAPRNSQHRYSHDFGAQIENSSKTAIIPTNDLPETQKKIENNNLLPSMGEQDSPTAQLAPQTTSKNIRKYLPSANASYLESQRNMGQIMGEGPIAGDLPEPPTAQPTAEDIKNRKVVVEREYSLAHYFDNLSRRFTDAWGPERTLPQQTTFTGILGEFIEYDIVINRDGTLRKIINVTAKKQTWRRFEDVDTIVQDVFSNVFPLPEIPNRIAQDPVVIRKRIQYTGYRYSIF